MWLSLVERTQLKYTKNLTGVINLKAAGYIRVSRFKNDEQVSPENQEQKIKMQANIIDAEDVEIYQDLDYSGGTDERPEFLRLMNNVAKGKHDCIIVYKLSRFSRSVLDFHKYMNKLDEHNVRLISVSENIDTSTPVGRLIRNIIIDFAQFERETIAETVRDNMHAHARSGGWNGGNVPFGYKLVDKQLLLDEKGSKIVHDIFNWAADGLGTTTIRNKLYSLNIKSPSGKPHWQKSSLAWIIRNPIYLGKFQYGGKVHDAKHEPIIDELVFKKANKQIEQRGKVASRTHSSTHLLSGLIKCPYCGRNLHARYNGRIENKRIRRYVCPSRNDGVVKCQCPIIDADSIEQAVTVSILELTDNDVIGKVEEELLAKNDHSDDNEKLLIELKKKLDEVKQAMKEMFSLYKDKLITKEQLAMMNEEYLGQEKELRREMEDAEIYSISRKIEEEQSIVFRNWVSNMKDKWNNSSLEERKDVLSNIVNKILITENGINIELTYFPISKIAQLKRKVMYFE